MAITKREALSVVYRCAQKYKSELMNHSLMGGWKLADIYIVTPERKRIINPDEDRYMISDFVPAIISAEMFKAVQEERQRRSNIVTDETGTHRKKVRYSSPANIRENTVV